MTQISFDAQDLHVTALTLLGEARGEGEQGMTAVAWVIRNRVEDPRWPSIPAEVCKQPWQFSTWNKADWNLGNLHLMAHADWDDETYRRAYAIAAQVFAGIVSDPTVGSNHYHAPSVSPSWATTETRVGSIGDHIFYRL